jgi:hypothetical protein
MKNKNTLLPEQFQNKIIKEKQKYLTTGTVPK